jgi:hypothetical protein
VFRFLLARPVLRSVCSRLPEAGVVVLAIALRLFVVQKYDPRWGYDAESHIKNVDWYRTHAGLPAMSENREAYHPPLFYVVEAAALRLAGATTTPLYEQLPSRDLPADLSLLQIVPQLAAALRIALVGLGLALLVPDRAARLVTLLLVAVLPVSVHLDAMVTNESLNMLFGTAAIILLPFAAGPSRGRRYHAVALGAVLGLGLLTKFSALALTAAVALTAGLDLTRPARECGGLSRPRRLAWWSATFALLIAIAGWLYVRNTRLHGEPAPTPNEQRAGWDRDEYLATGAHERPYWRRRDLNYFVGWDFDIFKSPFFPTASGQEPRFWPVLLASTFVDHYNVGLARDRDMGRLDDSPIVNGWPLRPAAIAAARVSLAGGCIIALTTVLAFLTAARKLCRSLDVGRLSILLVPLVVLAGQLHFATRFPVDRAGVVKGAYMQLVAAPLCALWGWAVAWLFRRPWGKVPGVLNLAALACVLSYVVVCLLLQRGVRSVVFWP